MKMGSMCPRAHCNHDMANWPLNGMGKFVLHGKHPGFCSSWLSRRPGRSWFNVSNAVIIVYLGNNVPQER